MSKLEGFYNMTVQLPAGLQCGHCVLQVCCSVSPLCNPLLQWTYTCGNSWGVCSEGGGRLGCGPQVTCTLHCHCWCGYYLCCDRRHSELVLTSPSSQLGLVLRVVSLGPLVQVL